MEITLGFLVIMFWQFEWFAICVWLVSHLEGILQSGTLDVLSCIHVPSLTCACNDTFFAEFLYVTIIM